MTQENRLIWRLLPALLLLAIVAGCAKKPPLPPPPPPPDVDGAPAGAQPLALDVLHADALDRSVRDLDDWYRVEIPSEGKLRIAIEATGTEGLPHLFLSATEPGGLAATQPIRAGGRPEVEIVAKVRPGTRLIWVGTDPEAASAVPYRVIAAFTAKPQPKPPAPPVERPQRVEPPRPPPEPPIKHETRVFRVIEGGGGGGILTISGGSNDGLEQGQQGRLREGGRVIATFSVVSVYPKGSRVRLNGQAELPISPRTSAEVDIRR